MRHSGEVVGDIARRVPIVPPRLDEIAKTALLALDSPDLDLPALPLPGDDRPHQSGDDRQR